MTSRRPHAPRSDSAGAPARLRWALGAACLTLLGAGAYWLAAEPPARSAQPGRVLTPGGSRSQQPAELRARRGARPATPDVPVTAGQRTTSSSEPAPEAETPPSEGLEPLDAPSAEEPAVGADTHAHGALPPEALEAPLEAAPEPAPRPEPRPKPRPRRLELSVLRRWRQPGLCARAEQASAAQQTLMSHFRSSELAPGARVFLDPRLPAGAEAPALGYLEEAQRIVQAELQLSPGVPDVFLYYDVQLLLASACTNADVVAFYDGALHVVVTRDDVRESVVHEFTHHALMTAGVLGPAWIQEGVAMHVARETWWRRPDLLQRLLERPFGLTTMETIVPYTLENEQAALFYVQAAAMVECATREPDGTLSGLLSEIDVQQSSETLDYGLPAPAELSALRECIGELLQEPGPASPGSPSR